MINDCNQSLLKVKHHCGFSIEPLRGFMSSEWINKIKRFLFFLDIFHQVLCCSQTSELERASWQNNDRSGVDFVSNMLIASGKN
jgi:hypothetical protein